VFGKPSSERLVWTPYNNRSRTFALVKVLANWKKKSGHNNLIVLWFENKKGIISSKICSL
jgi:hypothetical protein